MNSAETLPGTQQPSNGALDDAGLVLRAGDGDLGAFEALMRKHNAALFRVARSILKDEADAEDALQEAYLSAFRHLDDFKGQARLSTWLTRIVINQSLGQLRARKKDGVVVALDEHTGAVHDGGETNSQARPEESPGARTAWSRRSVPPTAKARAPPPARLRGRP